MWEAMRRAWHSGLARRAFFVGLAAGVVLTMFLSWALRGRSSMERLADRALQQAESVRELQRAYGINPDRPYDGFLPKRK